MKRVVITGAGTVNPLGHDVAATLAAMAAGRCGIGPLELRDIDRLSVKIGAQVKDWHAESLFSRADLSLFDRATQFAVIAAREAMAAANPMLSPDEAMQTGVIMGNAGGGMGTIDDCFRAVYQEGKARVHPLTVPRLMNSAAASNIGIGLGLRGPTFTVSSACASSNHAIGLAFQMVRAGAAPVMLTGGAEAMLTFGGIKAWEGLRVMSPDGCRPFSADRNGMVQGEGAAVFVLEDRDRALARGAPILAEICGFAMTADAAEMVMPSREGATRAISGALADGGIAPQTVGYINAHGTGTAANDRTESAAINDVFGKNVSQLLVSSTKSMHGHLIGGTGAIELLACIMALRDGIVPPTIGYRQPDPECPLDVVPNIARKAETEVAISNSFAFGGLNAVLALRRAQ